MFKRLRGLIVRQGVQTALKLGTRVAATATSKQFNQRFDLNGARTLFVHGDHLEVTVRRGEADAVLVAAEMRAAFGMEFVTDQDEAGVYIVIKRKPMVSAVSSAALTLFVPDALRLVFRLSPGSVRITDVDGKMTVDRER